MAQANRTRRRLTPEARRAELVDAALRLLERGVEAPNWVAAVTAEAKAAKGTFYLYFPSWDRMLEAVRARVLEEYQAPLYRALDAGGADYWALVDGECARFVDFVSAPGGLHRAVFHAIPELEADDAPPPVLVRLIEQGIDDGAFRDVDAEPAATLLFAALHAAADAVVAGGDRDRWLASLADLVRTWLGTR